MMTYELVEGVTFIGRVNGRVICLRIDNCPQTRLIVLIEKRQEAVRVDSVTSLTSTELLLSPPFEHPSSNARNEVTNITLYKGPRYHISNSFAVLLWCYLVELQYKIKLYYGLIALVR